MNFPALGVLILLLPGAALADTPPFDRPSFSFAPAVLPAGSFAWEQGLPDMERDSDGGARMTTYAADTVLRFGLTSNIEVQLHTSPWNRMTTRVENLHADVEGTGDSALGIKWAPLLDSKVWTLAVLGLISVDTGSSAFSNGHTVTSLGVAAGRDFGDNHSLGLYANVDHGAGQNTWTESANFNFPIQGGFGGFVQVGRFNGGGTSRSLAGGGITWLLHDCVQVDLGANFGLTSRSPDYQAGLGVSVFWK
ncbi:transporter [Thermomonas sp.]|uniref:transporter n=1 Tax=Thermomonas sp. TaxID=1971895 RepID=UPI00248A345E|nr:transporter [Thermomonas sp.]MDI1253412.1 transporter [Thermomonas sp.]